MWQFCAFVCERLFDGLSSNDKPFIGGGDVFVVAIVGRMSVVFDP